MRSVKLGDQSFGGFTKIVIRDETLRSILEPHFRVAKRVLDLRHNCIMQHLTIRARRLLRPIAIEGCLRRGDDEQILRTGGA